jgi:hypothetical protein
MTFSAGCRKEQAGSLCSPESGNASKILLRAMIDLA